MPRKGTKGDGKQKGPPFQRKIFPVWTDESDDIMTCVVLGGLNEIDENDMYFFGPIDITISFRALNE